MKIGILTSGNDTLALFSFLHRFDHEYVIRYDDLYGFWGDKPKSLVLDRVQTGLHFLREKGVDMIIVPPLVELMITPSTFSFSPILTPNPSPSERGIANILPLFQEYVKKCFSGSLVGKIGFFGDSLDIQEGQKLLGDLAKTYILTDNQRATRKFSFPFAFWGKEVRNWKYLLDTMSWSHLLMNRILKQDLRFFKDANVDTLIPLNYSYFHVEKTIHKVCNSKKMKFHGEEELEEVFDGLCKSSLVSDTNPPLTPPLSPGEDKSRRGNESDYSVSVFCTGHGEFLKREKRLMWLLERGKSVVVKIDKS